MNTRRHLAAAGTAALLLCLTPGIAQADQLSCGTPAQDAIFQTVHHPEVAPVTTQVKVVDVEARLAVAAVTHQETVVDEAAVAEVAEQSHPVFDYIDGEGVPEGDGWWKSGQEWTIVDEEAYTDYGWMRTVIDEAAVPAVPAVTHEEAQYSLVHGHDAVTHQEWKWQRTVIVQEAQPGSPAVSHLEYQYGRQVVDVPAHQQQHLVEEAHSEQVVDVPAHTVEHPATYDESLFAYVDKHNRTRYEPWGWNGGADGEHDSGWNLVQPVAHPVLEPSYVEEVPATYTTVHHDAVYETVTVPATYTHDYVWAATSPGDGWVLQPADPKLVVDEPAVPPTPEVSETEGSDYLADAPGEGWTKTTDVTTVVDQEAWNTLEFRYFAQDPGGDWEATGLTGPVEDEPAVPGTAEVSHPELGWSQDPTLSPWAGSGNEGHLTGLESSNPAETHQRYEWMRKVVDVEHQDAIRAVTHEETVVDVPALPAVVEQSHLATVVVQQGRDAFDEQVLVSEAVPAGEVCAVPTGPTDPTDPTDPTRPPVVNGPVTQTVDQIEVTAGHDPQVPVLVHTDGKAPNAAPSVLAHTGTPAGLMLTVAGAFLLGGAGLKRLGRKH